MMLPANLKVYLAPGATDLRKSINGLSALVEAVMELDLFSGYVFGFCNRNRDLVKLLYWDRNGFALWIKRLEHERFHWPNEQATSIQVTGRQLSWLLEGLKLNQKAHAKLAFQSVG